MMSTSTAMTSSSTTTVPHMSKQQLLETSSASSQSGSCSSAAGYRHNPYNCEKTLVYYSHHQQQQHAAYDNQRKDGNNGLSSTDSTPSHSFRTAASSAHPQRHNASNAQSQQLAYYLAQQQQQQRHQMTQQSSSFQNYSSVCTDNSNYTNDYIQPQHQQQLANYSQQQQYYEPTTHQYQYHNNDNYSHDQQFLFQQQRFASATPTLTRQPPRGTLHTQLMGRIGFALYPSVAFESLEPTLVKSQMVRMFIGQLPYNVTEMQLSWILHTFGAGANMYHFERITKTDHSKGGAKVPTGCFHCHMEAEQVGPLLKSLNDRLLVDDTGIWVCETAEERNLLAHYCQAMKVDKRRRFQGRPYGTVVAQVATSTFDPDTFQSAKYPAQHASRQH